jgi:acyl-CoA dehydrogenase
MADQSFLDWPFFEDHHRALAGALDDWAAKALPPIVDHKNAHKDVDATCRALVNALGEGGWLRYCVPMDYGGVHSGLDVRSLSIIRETLARHSGLADFAFAMQGLGSGAISMFGTDAQKRAYLPAVASGKKIAAFALTEPGAGSDAAAMTTHLQAKADHFVANGEKTFISNGGIADFYTLFARTDVGVSAIIVDANAPGLDIAERIEVMAPHPLARLVFKDCIIPKANLLDEEGRGFKVALSTLDVFRTTVGAAALGLARRALDEALDYARGRQMFGASLADLPLAQGLLAEMALDVDASALLVYRSAWTKDVQQKRVTREAAMAKLFATDQAQGVIDKAVQLLGGLGVTKGQKVEELYREVRALRIYEGASEVQKIVIARQLLQGN